MNYLHFSIFNVELFDAIGCFLEESMLLTLRTGFELRIWGKGVYCATNICCLNKRGHLTATFYFYFDETFNVLTRQQSKQWSPFEEVARVNYASRVVIWGILKSGKTLEWVEINDCRVFYKICDRPKASRGKVQSANLASNRTDLTLLKRSPLKNYF